MPGGDGIPIFRKGIGGRFALDLGHGFIDFTDGFAAPDGDLSGIRPLLSDQFFPRQL